MKGKETIAPTEESPTYTRTMERIRTRALGDPSDPKARMVPLYHGGHVSLHLPLYFYLLMVSARKF
ncbi:hypothetical protein E2C01_076568 [Portunus trituberculatus]|uniref:Uncharacterized protein n=1 Tax=Portunus trituberculatus TaxID=210409 RepID=A0A5B7IK28_PORTR|nr:hypothetical protein [Portunus trituberculatus]